MTILILDNGGSYSDHEIVFVDCQDWDPDEVVRVYKTDGSWRRAKEIGRAAAVEWRDPEAFTTVEGLLRNVDADEIGCLVLQTLSDRMTTLLRSHAWHPEAKMLLNLEIERRQQL